MKKPLMLIAILLALASGSGLHAQAELEDYPEVVASSLNGLQLIDRPWKQSTFFYAGTETFLMIKKVSGSHIIAISVEEDTYPALFYFYDIDEEGVHVNKQGIEGADYSIDNRFNLFEKKGVIYYFNSSRKREVFAYDRKSKTHEPVKARMMDWEKIDDWRSHYMFDSPEKNLSIELRDTELVCRSKEASDTLIAQVYDGSWSFGQGVWSKNSDKFYFDNSGAVACIWEIDLNNKTLNKIVPSSNWASHPLFWEEGEILFCDGDCIMKAISAE